VIVVDTCIISSLAKVGRLGLLRHLDGPCTLPGVVREITNSGIPVLTKGLSEALAGWLEVRTVKDQEELSSMQDRYPVLGHVDCELILLAKELGSALLTDDTRLIEEAEASFGLETFDLCDVLVVLRKRTRIDEKELDGLISMGLRLRSEIKRSH